MSDILEYEDYAKKSFPALSSPRLNVAALGVASSPCDYEPFFTKMGPAEIHSRREARGEINTNELLYS